MKYLTYFKKIVLLCVKYGWLDRDPFTAFKMNRKEVEKPFLTERELDVIADKKFPSERLTNVRDLFLFSCYTGLAYADVKISNRQKQTIQSGKGLVSVKANVVVYCL